ncbi:MAG: rod shape-determining protein MreD [Anaerolineae bacterium]|nr:rod shape-determining protein MreD [Anaerolineae bacterium]
MRDYPLDYSRTCQQPMGLSLYLALPVMVILLIIQTSVLPRFPLWGVVPQLMLLAAVAWGLLEGLEEGALWGFVAGILSDLFSITPVGLSALAFMSAVIVVALLYRTLPINRFVLPVILSLVATLIWLFVYLLLLRLMGFSSSWQQISDLPRLLLVHGGLVLPFYWFFYGLLKALRPRPIEV